MEERARAMALIREHAENAAAAAEATPPQPEDRTLTLEGRPNLLAEAKAAEPDGAVADASEASADAPETGASLAAATATTAQAEDTTLSDTTVVASWMEDGAKKTLTFGELKAERQSAIARIEAERHEALTRELEGYVIDRLMTAAAAKAGKTPQELLSAAAGAIPEEAVKKFYDENVARGGSGPELSAVEERIRQFLSMRATVDQVRAAAKLDISLPAPEVPTATFDLTDRPSKGAKDAKVTIVEFSDFQCPYCARATEPVEKILAAFPKDVVVYFMHYPLSFHEQAMPAAIAARCAQKQGKFWPMHDRVFADQSKLSGEDLAAHAKALELDAEKFDACTKDPATAAFVKADMEQGEKAGVGGTPSFYINGKAQQGIPTEESIRALIEG